MPAQARVYGGEARTSQTRVGSGCPGQIASDIFPPLPRERMKQRGNEKGPGVASEAFSPVENGGMTLPGFEPEFVP